MQLRDAGRLILAAALVLTPAAAFAQTTDSGAKQDMKESGHESKNAAKSFGHGVKQGTKKAYHKTKHGTKKVVHKVDGNPCTK